MESPPLSSSRSPRSRLVIGGRMDATAQPASQEQEQKMLTPDNDRTLQELREIDCNLSLLCDHIQIEGFNAGAFSDVVVIAMGSTYRLHRLILSRSSYFRNMLHGPWKEVDAPTVTLQIDDANVNSEAISMSLAYLYGQHPKLNDSNAFRVLAAASFLDLQELCAICTDFIISELWTTNFLVYQVFSESQDYGIHGERIRKACWGYLCQSATRELREVLPKLSAQTIHSLLTSDRLWVDNEEDRFSLALYILLTKSALHKEDHPEQETSSYQSGIGASFDSHLPMGQHLAGAIDKKGLKATTQNSLVDFSDSSMHPLNYVFHLKPETVNNTVSTQPIISDCANMGKMPSLNNLPNDSYDDHLSCSYTNVKDASVIDRRMLTGSSIEGPSEESTCYNFNSNIWSSGSQSRQFSSSCSSHSGMITSPSWGVRTLGWRQCRNAEVISGLSGEEFDAFMNIFEGGSLLYCNMSFGALLYSRKQLEDIGFTCKAVNDGLWLQMLLSHKIQEIGADTCKSCCLVNMSCACRHGYSQESTSVGYSRNEHDRSNASDNMDNVYVASSQGEGTGIYAPVRVHVRGPIDGLAGIGRGTTYVTDAVWPPTRFVFSRVPFGLGNRNEQQSHGNYEPEGRIDLNGDLSVDGLTTIVRSDQGSNIVPLNAETTERNNGSGLVNTSTTNSIPLQMLDSQEHAIGVGWDDSGISTLSLDMKTPLCHFPPFRFGVEFKDVHRLSDGQVKHSSELFYAGSLWKVTVQAFNDEDPQGRRTLGLFLHRRKAEPVDSLKKLNIYIDSREKVTARYQLICPSKRELMVFGNLKQPGTLLPKAPKGWGWRTALLFDELADLLQSGSLRVAVLVQLI